ncbi:hypothetical protein GGR55DRAFT_570675 [Xylaria sp. FL0064]|nr:hypothetical protein GGR55DRAFT_570675 [Xylaria sp. FL0064]
MYNTKVLLFVAAFTGASMAQTSTPFPAPDCASSISALVAAAPTIPPDFIPAFEALAPNGDTASLNLLGSPSSYVAGICSFANALPASKLSEFGKWGSSLLEFVATETASYDGVVTKCVAIGAEGAAITSYIHSIASHPGELCKITRSPSNGTATVTSSYPTATGNGTSSPTSSIPVAGAARHTGVLAGAAALGGLVGAVALL